jgi:MFS family permease
MSPIDEQTALLSHSGTAPAKASRVRWTLCDLRSLARSIDRRSLADASSPLPSRLAVWGSNLTFALSASAVGTLAPLISGSFDRVELGSYIGSLFSFSSVLATPLFGALAGPSASASASAGSGALSRRACLLLAGALFAAGQTICALAPDMGTFLLGRAIGGLGGAGILCLSSLITTGSLLEL